ncbi:hypothetical protein [Helicobacter sp. MIT 01-3238]|uniref:hypothetical protein n=1 Tax=Helicobacter sp. MIT 01-3238 TaxID=398627 RepID=UPI0015F15A35|nr:hypothetical protein [Helicobacter sp. MIT 01-3238]
MRLGLDGVVAWGALLATSKAPSLAEGVWGWVSLADFALRAESAFEILAKFALLAVVFLLLAVADFA